MLTRITKIFIFFNAQNFRLKLVYFNEKLIEYFAEIFLEKYSKNKTKTDLFIRSGIDIKESLVKDFHKVIIFHGSKGLSSNSKIHQKKIIKTIKWERLKTIALLTENQSKDFEEIKGAKNYNIVFIPPTINKISYKKEEKYNSKDQVSILIGNPRERKGIFYFADFIEKNKDLAKKLNITIIDLFEDKKLKNYFKKFENVKIVPPMNWSNLQKLYRENTFLYHFSKNDGFAMMCIESFLCGCIPILSNETMAKEYLPKNKFIKPSNIQELEDTLKNICNNDIDINNFKTDILFRENYEKEYNQLILKRFKDYMMF